MYLRKSCWVATSVGMVQQSQSPMCAFDLFKSTVCCAQFQGSAVDCSLLLRSGNAAPLRPSLFVAQVTAGQLVREGCGVAILVC